jgi:hypothetical protein
MPNSAKCLCVGQASKISGGESGPMTSRQSVVLLSHHVSPVRTVWTLILVDQLISSRPAVAGIWTGHLLKGDPRHVIVVVNQLPPEQTCQRSTAPNGGRHDAPRACLLQALFNHRKQTEFIHHLSTTGRFLRGLSRPCLQALQSNDTSFIPIALACNRALARDSPPRHYQRHLFLVLAAKVFASLWRNITHPSRRLNSR